METGPTCSLPEELWIFIAKNLNSHDVFNLLIAYPHISAAVHKDKTLLLFGKVLHFLVNWNRAELNDNIGGSLTLPDIKSCRLVCKHWSNEVDLMFETRDENLTDTSNSWESDLNRFYANQTIRRLASSLDVRFQSTSDFDKFSKEFETLAEKRNPFPSRSLTISFATFWHLERLEETDELIQAANEGYWNLLIKFLQKFGGHVKHFSLTMCFIFDRPQNYDVVKLKNLATCLRLLPNLRRLELCTSSLWDKRTCILANNLQSVVASEFHAMPKVEIAEFKCADAKLLISLLNVFNSLKRVKLEPIVNFRDCQYPPTMPNLKRIEIFPVLCDEQAEFVNFLARATQQLSKIILHCTGTFEKVTPCLVKTLETFPNRQEFELKLNKDKMTLVIVRKAI